MTPVPCCRRHRRPSSRRCRRRPRWAAACSCAAACCHSATRSSVSAGQGPRPSHSHWAWRLPGSPACSTWSQPGHTHTRLQLVRVVVDGLAHMARAPSWWCHSSPSRPTTGLLRREASSLGCSTHSKEAPRPSQARVALSACAKRRPTLRRSTSRLAYLGSLRASITHQGRRQLVLQVPPRHVTMCNPQPATTCIPTVTM